MNEILCDEGERSQEIRYHPGCALAEVSAKLCDRAIIVTEAEIGKWQVTFYLVLLL